MEPIFRTVNLEKKYTIKSEKGVREISAIKNVSLEVFRGETFGIIGESGSGKTTLGKTIIRLTEPTGGEIFFRDTNITGLNSGKMRGLRKRFQIIFQDPYKSLNPRMSAGTAISEGLPSKLSRNEKTLRTGELLEMVGIGARRYGNYPHQFSGGERQRVAIARALSTNPEFIVCDEPTSNLDLSIQAKILNLFIELKEKLDLTYLFISHNLKVIEFLTDRVAVMFRGEIVETGKTCDVINNPKHPYTKILVEKGRMHSTS